MSRAVSKSVLAGLGRALAEIATSRQSAGSFVFGLAVGSLLGYYLVVRERAGAERVAPSPAVIPPAEEPGPGEAAPPIVWKDRADTFGPSGVLEIPRGAAVWKGEITVAVAEEAMAAMHAHASSDPERERVGLLLGRAGYGPGTPSHLTVVQRAVPLPSSDANATHVALTSESLPVVAESLRDLNLDSGVVGWFHTHPALGVFLSGTDLFTQQTCFAQPWHVAIVLDPVRKDIGVFTGPNGARARQERQDS